MAVPFTIDATTARVRLIGELDLAGKADLRTHVAAYLADPAVREVAIDLAGLTFLDSTGIGALISCLRRADGTDKYVHASGAQGQVAKVLDMIGVTPILAGQTFRTNTRSSFQASPVEQDRQQAPPPSPPMYVLGNTAARNVW